MSNLNLDECYDKVMELTKISGQLIKDAIKKAKSIEEKLSPRDLVTETDKAVEELLIKSLSTSFPSHKFIGEESTAAGIKSELTDDPTWIIDPVDGTMNFVHSFPYTCISIALWVNKTAEIGIVFNPVLNQMFTARRGQGAFLNDEKIKVSGIKDLSKSLVFTEMGTRHDAKKMQIIFNNLQAIMKRAHGVRVQGTAALNMCCIAAGYGEGYYHVGLHCWDMAAGYLIIREAGGVVVDMTVRCMGSAALNMCYVAMGGIEAYYEIGIHAWDTAAGALVVTEAGGYVCDVTGGPFDVLSRRVVCASSKEVADELVATIETFEEERD